MKLPSCTRALLLLLQLLLLVVCSSSEDANETGEAAAEAVPKTRNAREESVCRPFLTSSLTSPLVASTKRNLKRDEDAEFSCELVLQDVNLPMQIRVTIHEGLAWLAIRHVQMGLVRHKTVIRHLQLLAKMVPKNFGFQYRAGSWGLDVFVNQPEEAVHNLHECVYGKASEDASIGEAERLAARRDYAKALGLVGRYREAQVELLHLLRLSPLDFGLAFLLKDATRMRLLVDKTSSAQEMALVNAAVQEALAPSQDEYARLSALASNDYAGFVPPLDAGYTIKRIKSLPTAKEFAAHVERREPLLISLGSSSNLNTALGWHVDKWLSSSLSAESYLLKAAGEELVQIESRLTRFANSTNMMLESVLLGHGCDVQRAVVPFERFLKDHYFPEREKFKDKERRFDEPLSFAYLNTQRAGTGKDIYRPPLHKLKGDIDPPFFLEQSVWENMKDVNIWMGHARGASSVSRLHMDATDNLYILLQGKKDFTLFPPLYSQYMKTISPTIATSPNGLSYQFKQVNSTTEGHNLHFSEATSLLDEVLAQAKGKELHVSLEPGDLLYLPTGWFHQVASSTGRHMALNYWWKPPGWEQAVEFDKRKQAEVYASYKKTETHSGDEL